jgi:hypothetical protein
VPDEPQDIPAAQQYQQRAAQGRADPAEDAVGLCAAFTRQSSGLLTRSTGATGAVSLRSSGSTLQATMAPGTGPGAALAKEAGVRSVRAAAAPSAGTRLRDRVLGEARLAARFSHPGAVVLHDVLVQDGPCW